MRAKHGKWMGWFSWNWAQKVHRNGDGSACQFTTQKSDKPEPEVALFRKKAISFVKKQSDIQHKKNKPTDWEKLYAELFQWVAPPLILNAFFLLFWLYFIPIIRFFFFLFWGNFIFGLSFWYLGLSFLLFSSSDPNSTKCFSQGESTLSLPNLGFFFCITYYCSCKCWFWGLVGFEGLSTTEVWIPSPQKADCFRLNMLSRPSRFGEIRFSYLFNFMIDIFFFQ